MRRCPNCQTTSRRADAESCWYCGFHFVGAANYSKPSKTRRPASNGTRRRHDQEDARPEMR